MTNIPAHTRHDLTDQQWALLEPLLPAPAGTGRPRTWPIRDLINGIFFRTRAGCPWRDIPDTYGPWWRIYNLFARFQANQIWQQISTALIIHENQSKELSLEVSVDSTICRGHVHGAGARTDSQVRHPAEPADHGFGRSRGGFSTKIHAAVSSEFIPLSFLITPGQAGDCPEMIPVLELIEIASPPPGRPVRRPKSVLADKAYSSKANRQWLREHKISAAIPERSDQIKNRKRKGSAGGRPPKFDQDVYARRNVVERAFGFLKHNRGCAMRCDKLAVRFTATVLVGFIRSTLKRLS